MSVKFASIAVYKLTIFSSTQDVCIDVVGIVNDTTGTLMACAHRNKNCCVGLIIGGSRDISLR